MDSNNQEISLQICLDKFYPISRPPVETLNQKVKLEEITDGIFPQQNCLLDQLSEPPKDPFDNDHFEVLSDETSLEISQEQMMMDQKQDFQFKPIGQFQFQDPEAKPLQNQGHMEGEPQQEVSKVFQVSQAQEVENKSQEKGVQNSQDSSNSAGEKPKKKISKSHLRGTRKSKNNKTQLQKQFTGYWMKNYLQFGKKPHFDWIFKKNSLLFSKTQNPEVAKILNEKRQKVGIGLQDYLALYKIEALEKIWEEFFDKKVLYRELMLSRAEPLSKVAFAKFLHRYEEAFRTKIFDHIA